MKPRDDSPPPARRSVFQPCPNEEVAPPPPVAGANAITDRLVRLESLVMHLQHDFETLNSVVLDQRKQIDRLHQQLSRMDDRVSRLGAEDETRDPEAERPPHY